MLLVWHTVFTNKYNLRGRVINLEQSLEAFVKSEHRVMVIKGDWGVGKTYAWNKYIETHGGSLTQIAYSYISLFGKNSLQDIKKSIFIPRKRSVQKNRSKMR